MGEGKEWSAASRNFQAGVIYPCKAHYVSSRQKKNRRCTASTVGEGEGGEEGSLKLGEINKACCEMRRAFVLLVEVIFEAMRQKNDVLFRRGEMTDAERSYLTANQLDPKEVHAYLGLARLYAAYSLYRKAYELLTKSP